MKTLNVWIEINGKSTYVGMICGNHAGDARFTYAKEDRKSVV